MGVTSQVTDCDHLICETSKGMVSVGNARGIVAEPFIGPYGQIRERLRHQDIPSIPTGLMGDIPCFKWVNLYPSIEYKTLKAISSTSRYRLELGLKIRTHGRSSSRLLMLNLITYAMLNNCYVKDHLYFTV